ncbi:hypothetical protein EYV94_27720 [Puteibacter caeruleilacunae]|nr:hypothetical protein EYV94_27720 [Puteibacter caeruleilacunae]
MENYKSTKDANGNWTTYCNQGTMTVARTAKATDESMGMTLPIIDLVNGTADEINGNLSALTPIYLEAGQKDAASGNLVVGGWKKHVFTMRKDGQLNNVGSWTSRPNNIQFQR